MESAVIWNVDAVEAGPGAEPGFKRFPYYYVGRNEAMSLSGTVNRPRPERGRRDCFDCFDLFHRVGTQINLGRLHVSMTEPKRDLTQVTSCLEDRHGAGVAK